MGIKIKKDQPINQNNDFCDTCGREAHQKCNCGKGNKGKTQEELNETAKYWNSMNKKS